MLARTFSGSPWCSLPALLLWSVVGLPARADSPLHDPTADEIPPDGIHVLDGSCVLTVGALQVNITNHGLIGSQFTTDVPYNQAPSAQWPAGSGDEYLWGAGLWVGGRVGSNLGVTTGQPEREWRPGSRLRDTIYEGRNGYQSRPEARAAATGFRLPDPRSDDDGDGRQDEDWLNGLDDDGDGEVDEDFGQLGDQMFTCTMRDDYPLISEIYPSHLPLGLEVVQRAAAWSTAPYDNIVALDFEITNRGFQTVEDVYVGFYTDSDIQSRASPTLPDDLAGFFAGIVRGHDDRFYRVEVAYMLDGAREDPLPGCLGVQMLDHTTSFLGREAPFRPAVRSFQIISTGGSVAQGGEPLSDDDRYYLMQRDQIDPDTRADEAAELKTLISSGPFPRLEPGRTLDYSLALVIGFGVQGMLETAVHAAQLAEGRWYDADGLYSTGGYGRETKVCLGDFASWETGEDPIIGHRIDLMNDSCTGGFPVMFYDIITEEMTQTVNEDGNFCIWVNMDNCEECLRVMGRECDAETFWEFRDRGNPYYLPQNYTGVWGREAHYRWTVPREEPPLAPSFRLVAGDRQVEVFWDDRSQHDPDPDTGVVDFESYRVWRLDHWVRPAGVDQDVRPPDSAWQLVAEHDLINFIPAGVGGSGNERTLGRNTGLASAVYRPACLDDAAFAGLAEAMQAVVDADAAGLWVARPPVRRFDGTVVAGLEPLVPWETRPDVLDTFFAVTARAAAPGVMGKAATVYYHQIDPELPNGFPCYYSVTASDHQLVYDEGYYLPAGYGVDGMPGNSFLLATPRPEAQTAAEREHDGLNIYVYPNPATRDALQEFLAQSPTRDDPTGVRVMWNNLPRAHNVIHIFTESGDLVKTLHHDGFTQGGSVAWNLVSRNGQEVTSGIYLYVVKSDDGAFPDFQGWFAVVQ